MFVELLAAVAVAQASAPVIWQDLTYGMTRAQVDAVVPDKKLILSPECDATISPFYRGREGLTAVRLNANQRPGMSAESRTRAQRCQDLILSSLLAKYGDPVRSGPEEPPCADSTPACRQQLGFHGLNPDIETVWESGNVEINLVFPKLNPGSWRIIYSYRPDAVQRTLPAPTAAPNL
jgi:hypothetical protein